MKILIKVTKEILNRSKSCPFLRVATEDEVDYLKANCALSLAWREMFPGAMTYQSVTILGRNIPTIRHSREMVEYIQAFDYAESEAERINLPEKSFEIDLPQKAIDRIGISEVYRILSESRTLELVQP